MRSQIAITRSGVTKASTGKAPPDGGVLARRVNGNFTITLHRKVSEMALVQLLRSLRALSPEFRMTLDTSDRSHEDLTRRLACHRIALQATGIIERANEPMFMSNIELLSDVPSPPMLQSENLLKLAGLKLAGCDAPSALMKASAADIANLVVDQAVHRDDMVEMAQAFVQHVAGAKINLAMQGCRNAPLRDVQQRRRNVRGDDRRAAHRQCLGHLTCARAGVQHPRSGQVIRQTA